MNKVTFDIFLDKKEDNPLVYERIISRISEIESLDEFDRLKIYMHYYIVSLDLRRFGFDKIKTLEEFYSYKNIEIRDCGENWEEQGYAQRWWVEYYGAYDWIRKFRNKIKLSK